MPAVDLPESATDYTVTYELTVTDGDAATATDTVSIEVGGAVTAIVRFGTIRDGDVAFYEAAAIGAGPVFKTVSAGTTAATPGQIRIPTTDLLSPNPFQPTTLYLAQATNGAAVDINDDGIIGGGEPPLLGAGHALLTGAQILAGDFFISELTELAYQRVASRVMAGADPANINLSLDQTARMQLLGDFDGDMSIAGPDLRLWDSVANAPDLRRPDSVATAKSSALNNNLPTLTADAGSALQSVFISNTESGSEGVEVSINSNTVLFMFSVQRVSAVDITDIDAPVLLDTVDLTSVDPMNFLSITDYAQRGTDIFVTTSRDLIAINATNPSALALLDDIQFPQFGAGRIAVQGNYAYVTGSNGLQVYDVSDTSNLQFVTTVGTGSLNDVTVNGNVLLVTTGGTNAMTQDRVRAYSLTNPALPMLMDEIDVGALAGPIWTGGGNAFAYADNETLVSLDISDLSALSILDSVTVPGDNSPNFSPPLTASFQQVGDLLYVSAVRRNFVVNVANPAMMELAGFTPLPGNSSVNFEPSRGQVLGERWLRGTNQGFLAYDVAYLRPAVYDSVEDFSLSQVASDTANRVYAANGAGIRTYQSNADGTLTLLGFTAGFFFAVTIQAEFPYVYLSTFDNTIILDVRDPNAVITVGQINLPKTVGSSTSICVRNGIVYKAILTESAVEIIDASDPANPTLANTLDLSPSTRTIARSCDSSLYVNVNNDLSEYDLTDPLAPQFVANIDFSNLTPNAMDANGTVLVSVGNGIEIIDIDPANPNAPELVTSFPISFSQDVVIDDEFVYVATSRNGLLSISLDGDNAGSLDSVVPDIPPFNSIAVTDFAVIVSSDGRLASFRKAVQPAP